MSIKTYRERIQQLSLQQRKQLLDQLNKSTETNDQNTGHQQLVAYVVGSGPLDMVNLNNYVQEQLPDYMLPSSIVKLDKLPRLPNGKLDLKALPEPEDSFTDPTDHVAPRTTIEQQLAETWEAVLNFSPVGIHDNFFEIGGDSILSIQVISRARRAGLKLTPNQLFEHQTIAELALFVRSEDAPKEQIPISSGPAILTPIQEWFFETHRLAPHYWNQGISINLPTDTPSETIRQAIGHLLERHDALRLAFFNQDGKWSAEVKSSESTQAFQIIDLSDATEEDDPAKLLSDRIASIQAGFELLDGSLFQAIYIVQEKQNAQLVLLAHHLIIDAISWKILIDELAATIEALNKGEEISLPPNTISYSMWGSYLSNYVSSDKLGKELTFWKAQSQEIENLTADFDVLFPIPESRLSLITHQLLEEETQKMLNEANQAYNTRVDEFLITSLMMALKEWVGISEICLGLERHGRELLDKKLDFSSSVGWFTVYYPLRLAIDKSDNLGSILKSIKEQIRQVPQGGLGYGVLRYLDGQTELNQQPPILFNYLGNQDQLESPILGKGEFIEKHARSPESERYYQLEINAFVSDGKLKTQWSYGRDQYKADTIKKLVSAFESSLLQLIDHCIVIGSGGYTPSDFPDVDLSQDDLDRLFDQLDS